MYKKHTISVVIPAFDVEGLIENVLKGIPEFVDSIIVVDDCSSDGTYCQITNSVDPRVIAIRNKKNQGVGGATLAGFERALQMGAAIVVKMDGDGQMDPRYLPDLLDPLIEEGYAYTKGNRFLHSKELSRMPKHRLFGNFVLTFLMKLTSGYWTIFDPQNGYVAIKGEILRLLEVEKITKRYFFENDILIQLNIHHYRVKDISMPAIYGEEKSSMKISLILLSFPVYLFKRFLYRIYQKYVLRDFSPIAIFLFFGALMLLWGGAFGLYTWFKSITLNEVATTGTVMLSVLPFLVGFELILQAIILDINSTPK